VQARGKELASALINRLGNHPRVGDIRGRGLFWGIELVADRASKATFDPAFKLHARVKKEAMARGLCCYPMGGTVDGRHGDHVLLAPPFIITTAQIGEIGDKISGAIEAAIKSTTS
jgi:adenosylmethionine-8-amino-7-oxononanoate aminotransferase